MNSIDRLGAKVLDIFNPNVDPRVYAATRIAFALCNLANLAALFPLRSALFSNNGLIPLETVRDAAAGSSYWSLLYFTDNMVLVNLFYAAAVAAAIGLLRGRWMRLSIGILWIWNVSYTYRILPASHGWEILLRAFGFWLMISPLGPRGLASQSPHGAKPPEEATAPGYGLLIMRLQLVFIYWESVWFKVADEYWRNGEFMAYFLMSSYSNFPSHAWAERLELSNALTYGALAIEIAVPALLFSQRFRRLAIFTGLFFHALIGLMTPLSLFALSMMFPYALFLDSRDIDGILRFKSGAKAMAPTLLRRARKVVFDTLRRSD